VLGIVLEKVAGQPLDVILRDRLCQPLGLRDTGLFVPPEHAGRVVQPLTRFSEGATLVDFTQVPRFRSGGSGCYSTAADYLCSARMLLSGGESGRRDAGVRTVVTRNSLDLIMTDQLGPLAGTGPDYIPGPGYTFGLGMALGLPGPADSSHGAVAQDAWWLGRAATSFFVDPRQELIGVLMTQRYWKARQYQEWFKHLVYQAIM
jgi:CubicO group peptidase (beta-lactamase class C family)